MCVAGVLTVNHLSFVGFAEEVDESGIDICSGGDPFVVGWGMAGGPGGGGGRTMPTLLCRS